jgi:hypothetical protein
VQPIGEIVRVQVQQSTLKVPAEAGAAHPVRYDPGPLIEVRALLLTSGGAVGVLDSGDQVIDVHHIEHPNSKNAERVNDLSLGFTTHYAAMRDRFGAHVEDGIAGENVLVASDRPFTLEDLLAGVVIETADGERVVLDRISVAEPCVPFTRFSLGLGPTESSGTPVTDGLRFLRDGRRGFYATYDGTRVTLRPGDRVFRIE